MAEKPVDVVKEEVEEYKVETFDNPIVLFKVCKVSLICTRLAPKYFVPCVQDLI